MSVKYCECIKPEWEGSYTKDENGRMRYYCDVCGFEIEPKNEKAFRLLKEERDRLAERLTELEKANVEEVDNIIKDGNDILTLKEENAILLQLLLPFVEYSKGWDASVKGEAIVLTPINNMDITKMKVLRVGDFRRMEEVYDQIKKRNQ